VLEELLEKAKFVDWYGEERKEYFAVFSRAGFTKKAMGLAREREFLLFTLKDFDRVEGNYQAPGK
jgi:hypothetical protein